MARIAIIDDNKDQSSTVQANTEIALAEIGSDLEVITSVPFKDQIDWSQNVSSSYAL